MNIRDEIIHGNAVHNIVFKIYKYWNEKYNTNSSECIIEKTIKADKWIISHNDDIDEKDLFEEMIYILEENCSMTSAFQNDLENYKKEDLRIVWVDRKPILLDFSSDHRISPQGVTQYAREAQDILNMKELINCYNKDVLKIVKSLYIYLDYLKPDLFSAQRKWEELWINSGLFIFKKEYSGKQYTDNPMFIAKKIKEYF